MIFTPCLSITVDFYCAMAWGKFVEQAIGIPVLIGFWGISSSMMCGSGEEPMSIYPGCD
jgi:hypothetical protein